MNRHFVRKAVHLVHALTSLGLIATERNPKLINGLAELALALVLFIGAAGADLGVLRKT